MLGTVKNALVVWMGIIFLAELVTPLQVGHRGSLPARNHVAANLCGLRSCLTLQ